MYATSIDPLASSATSRTARPKGRRRWASRSLAAAAMMAVPGWLRKPAVAQQQVVTLIVPYAAGGGADIVGREFAQAFGQELRQTVVVDNRGGAAGFIGAAAVARARPDGATLLFAVNTNVVLAPHLQANDRADLATTLAAVAHLSDFPYVLVVDPALGVSTLRELVNLAKAKPPGSLTFSSTGVGSNGHVAGLLLAEAAGIQMEHIAYRGAAPAIMDVVAHRISMNLSSPPPTIPLAKDGRLRALVVTGSTRLPTLPEVPTLAEAGMPGITIMGWHGLFAPPGTPADILDTYGAAAKRATSAPRFVARLASDGLEPAPESTRAAFAAAVQEESAFWARKARELDLRME